MLEYFLDKEDPVTLAMKILYHILEPEVIENEEFFWNPYGDTDASTYEEMPNFWWKRHNIQIAWWYDNPARGGSSNVESTGLLAVEILVMVMEWLNGKKM